MSNLIATPYLSWLFIFVVLPTIILWSADYKSLWRYKVVFFHCFITALVIGVAWDFFAIITKIWEWPSGCCSLPRVAGLPLEETLFIVSVTFLACTTTLVARDVYLNHLNHQKR